MALAQILHRLALALGLAQDSDDLLVGKSLLHRVLLASRIKENSLAKWLQETAQVTLTSRECVTARGRLSPAAGRRPHAAAAPAGWPRRASSARSPAGR
ncbi:hypothetical protein FCJ57_22515 [Burkholderia diffusa]|nr:hypothetical protein [Burkholderia diffusa]